MSDVTLKHGDGSDTVIENPEFVDVLCHINEVAVDGEIYENVDEVVFEDNDL